MTVNTHNGLFSNAGYGGGMFNGNTAFGEYSGHHYGDVSNLNAPYDNVSLQGLGSLLDDIQYILDGSPTATPVTGKAYTEAQVKANAGKFPWLVVSEDTRKVQVATNKVLGSEGYVLLAEDGKLGPRTCGALSKYGALASVYGSCDAHTAEFIAPVKATASAPTTATTAAALQKKEAEKDGVPMWLWAALAGSAAVGAAIYLKKKKRG